MSKCEFSLKVLQIANFSQITHSSTFLLITHLLKMSKCEFSLKVLQIANFSQITHSSTFGKLSHGEVSDP